MRILRPEGKQQLAMTRRLFEEYAGQLGFDLDFQDFKGELRSFPGEYTPPGGYLLLGMNGPEPAGCVAYRKIEEGLCEMKRLYVRSEYRGLGYGRILAAEIMRQAVRAGYLRMRLDTVPWMTEAITLYESLGFRDISPYRVNPIEGARYMEADLTANSLPIH